jgi:hypothetical protein
MSNITADKNMAWGPPIWKLFHTLAEKVNEEKYLSVAHELVGFIRRICSLLPCPDCQNHAIKYWSTTKYNLTSKEGLKTFLFNFHNDVNKRKNRSQESSIILDQYRDNNLSRVYNEFILAFRSRGNTRLLADSLHRQRLLNEFRPWLLKNAVLFS